MSKSGLSEEQMVAILREADRSSVVEAGKKPKLSERTICSLRKHYGDRFRTVQGHRSP